MRKRFTAGLLSLAMVGALAAPITANAEGYTTYTGSFTYDGNEYSTSITLSDSDKAALNNTYGVDFDNITFDSVTSSSDSSSSWSSISSSSSKSYSSSSPVVLSANSTLKDLIGLSGSDVINGNTILWQILGVDGSASLDTKISDLTK